MAGYDATGVGANLSYLHAGLTPFWVEVTVTAEMVDNADDYILLLKFPERAYIPNTNGGLAVFTSDIDTGTGVVALAIGLGDDDGTIDTNFAELAVSDLDGQELAFDATRDPWIDASGKYLIADVTTAANVAADGTITVVGCYAGGLREDGVTASAV